MTRQEEIHSVSNQLSELYKCSKTFKMGFEAGAKWADEHPKYTWISVNDDLPCNYPDNIHCYSQSVYSQIHLLKKGKGFPVKETKS